MTKRKSKNSPNLISPYGGTLINLVVANHKKAELLRKARYLPSIQLTMRSLQDLELLAIGAFSPLDRFMAKADYHQVLEKMRLSNGMIFPIPITLPIQNHHSVHINKQVVLRSPQNEIIAIMTIHEIYRRNFLKEAHLIYGTRDPRHPLISEMASWGNYYFSGPLEIIQLPKHYDFTDLRLTPYQVRTVLSTLKSSNVVAFQTRNPMHRAHETLTKKVADQVRGTLLIHPTVGITKPDDVDYFTRIRTHKVVYKRYYDHNSTILSVLPLAMRFAGPKEAVWHAIIRRNYGANYFIVGRDHASPGLNSKGKSFYDPEAAQKLMQKVAQDIGIKPVFVKEIVYDPQKKQYVEVHKIASHHKYHTLSGTKIRNFYLANQKRVPRWYARPEVVTILSEAYVPIYKKGFCVWFTGLPCSGKSTIASILQVLLENAGRKVTLLDGDIIRTHLSKGLGFSKKDRDMNILRIGFVASEIVKHNGAVICAAVSPYREIREQVRNMMPPGLFILTYVDTPITICEKRDHKGMYEQARKGILRKFTGISDPYEPPIASELQLNTEHTAPEANAKIIFDYLKHAGFIKQK